jgi:ferric-dicitrate binding protein FerR (iron transport regulator)
MNTTVTEEMTNCAIEWFVRLRAEDVTNKERESFVNWLQAASEHQQAFTDILKMWEGLSVVKQWGFEELRPFPQIWNSIQKAEVGVAS